MVSYFCKGEGYMKETTTSTKKVKKKRKILKTVIITTLSVIIIGIVAGAGVILAVVKTAPDLNTAEILDLKETSVIYDDKGNKMDDVIMTDKNGQVIKRTVVSLKDTSPYLGAAFIAIEDERFREHNGVDYRGITRAGLLYLQKKLFHKSGDVQGASTLTQQLIKYRLFLADSMKDRENPTRKIQEAYLALKLEKVLKKDEILDAYMNTIFFGGTAYGVEAASYQYFSKTAKNLTLVESAFIAGIAQSPSGFYPFGLPASKKHSIYLNKTKLVLDKMYKTNSISKQDYDNALNTIKTKEIVFTQPPMSSTNYTYEYFSMPVVAQIKLDLIAKDYTPAQVDALLVNGGLKIYTTMDRTLQDEAQNIMNTDQSLTNASNKLLAGDKTHPKVASAPVPLLQSAAVVFDYHTGQVKTIIGGRGAQAHNSYNRAVDTKLFARATGSSIKPIASYGAAIDTGQATAATIIDDSLFDQHLLDKYGGYNPHDDGNNMMGPISIRTAIISSQNLVALKLEDKIGLDTGYSYAQKFGLKLKPADKTIATLGLGQFGGGNSGDGQSPLIMAAAYGVFGNAGKYAEAKLYTKVKDRTGKDILKTEYTTRKAVEPTTAYIMYDLLKGPIEQPRGTARPAHTGFPDMPIAGKTGTATDAKDLWFCGLSAYYSAAVWIGADDARSLEGTFSSPLTSAVWAKIMKVAHTNLAAKDVPKPAGLKSLTICLDSGKQAGENCRKAGRTFKENMFAVGSEPTAYCDQHYPLPVNRTNGKLANDHTPPDLVEQRVFLKGQPLPAQDDTPIQQTPPPGDNQPGGNQPGGNQPGGNQPGGNQPGGNQPGGNQPVDPNQPKNP